MDFMKFAMHSMFKCLFQPGIYAIMPVDSGHAINSSHAVPSSSVEPGNWVWQILTSLGSPTLRYIQERAEVGVAKLLIEITPERVDQRGVHVISSGELRNVRRRHVPLPRLVGPCTGERIIQGVCLVCSLLMGRIQIQ